MSKSEQFAMLIINSQGGKLTMYKVLVNTFSQVRIGGEHVLLCKSPQSSNYLNVFHTEQVNQTLKQQK